MRRALSVEAGSAALFERTPAKESAGSVALADIPQVLGALFALPGTRVDEGRITPAP